MNDAIKVGKVNEKESSLLHVREGSEVIYDINSP